MKDATNVPRDKNSVEKYLRELEKNLPEVKKSNNCDWCGKPTPSPCKTVAQYDRCRNK
jgi:hypothetical protein